MKFGKDHARKGHQTIDFIIYLFIGNQNTLSIFVVFTCWHLVPAYQVYYFISRKNLGSWIFYLFILVPALLFSFMKKEETHLSDSHMWMSVRMISSHRILFSSFKHLENLMWKLEISVKVHLRVTNFVHDYDSSSSQTHNVKSPHTFQNNTLQSP